MERYGGTLNISGGKITATGNSIYTGASNTTINMTGGEITNTGTEAYGTIALNNANDKMSIYQGTVSSSTTGNAINLNATSATLYVGGGLIKANNSKNVAISAYSGKLTIASYSSISGTIEYK